MVKISNANVLQMSSRCQVAREFQVDKEYKIPLVVDTMDNHFNEAFGAWPARFFIVLNNVLVFKVFRRRGRRDYMNTDTN